MLLTDVECGVCVCGGGVTGKSLVCPIQRPAVALFSKFARICTSPDSQRDIAYMLLRLKCTCQIYGIVKKRKENFQDVIRCGRITHSQKMILWTFSVAWTICCYVCCYVSNAWARCIPLSNICIYIYIYIVYLMIV